MPDYKQAKIYRIVNDSIPDKVYYGSTCQKLSMRMSTHRCYARSKNNTSKQLFETGKAIIVLVEEFPCNSKEELLRRERYYIENNNCINRNIPGRTIKDWRIDNQDYNKKYYENNKEKHKEYYKKYNKVNRKKNCERNAIKITCECGKTVTKGGLSRHKKTNLHKKKSALLL